MPFKSKAQMDYMNKQADMGKMDKSMVAEMNDKSKGMPMPERAPKQPKAGPKIKNMAQLRKIAKSKGA